MLTDLENFIATALTDAGFSPYTDFDNVDTLKVKDDYIAFFSLNDLKYSSRFYSFYSDEYAVELSGVIDINAFGKMAGGSDLTAFRNKCLQFVENLFSDHEIVISQADLGHIETDHVLKRLKSGITIRFKLLIKDDVEEE